MPAKVITVIQVEIDAEWLEQMQGGLPVTITNKDVQVQIGLDVALRRTIDSVIEAQPKGAKDGKLQLDRRGDRSDAG